MTKNLVFVACDTCACFQDVTRLCSGCQANAAVIEAFTLATLSPGSGANQSWSRAYAILNAKTGTEVPTDFGPDDDRDVYS